MPDARPAPDGRLSSSVRRLESIDVVRGLAVAGMIVVNNPGDWTVVYPPLLHAYWTGLTVADLVFPAFIFVMGLAMPFAFARRWMAGASTREIDNHIARRVALLIALGLVLNAVSNVSPLRVPGVLQRIALAYFVASSVMLHVRPSRWLLAAAVLLVVHWALLILVPFGDHPAGTMTPDDNLARFIDTLVFGRHALTIPIDPEGLLGTLTASATAVLGAVAGDLVRRAPDNAARLRGLTAGSAAALSLGLIWSRALPLSKPLWTGSFVLVTAGLTTIVFALMYFIVDMRGLRRWCRPFMWLGANALVIYVGSEVVRRLLDEAVVTQGSGRTTPKAWVFWDVLEPAFRPWPEAASFVFAVGVLAMWMVVAAVLYRWLGARGSRLGARKAI
jgi:predicted acyltransferase